jgi:hypothetical protein
LAIFGSSAWSIATGSWMLSIAIVRGLLAFSSFLSISQPRLPSIPLHMTIALSFPPFTFAIESPFFAIHSELAQ